jgi:pyruvate dehydrogenase E1 component beta subunit
MTPTPRLTILHSNTS